MKKMMFMAILMAMTITANAMSYKEARNEALYLSDKMAYELDLTDAQYDAVYEINLDYLMSLNGHADVLGIWWDRRNTDLRYVLNSWQYDKYVALSHFYRPVAWKAGNWTFAVYSHYNRGHFYKARPKVFVTYKGGNSHKSVTHYADRKVNKPNIHHGKPAIHNDNKTWRNTNATGGHSHNTSNRQVAQNNSRGNGSGHFGRR